ncbi:MAG: Crp/Fnr family transcriptional regulator [Bacteroidota bacterium]
MSPAYHIYQQSMLAIYPELSSEEWHYLQEHTCLESRKRKTHVLQAGEVQKSIPFVVSGLIRGYYHNEKGEDITISFAKEHGYVTHYAAFLAQTPSQYSFQCLEDSEIIQLPYEAMQAGYRQFQGLERFGRLIAEQILSFQQQRITAFQFLSAEERYLQFLADFPDLFHRVSLSHLASYLGIQRPSLSRIRKQLAEKGTL